MFFQERCQSKINYENTKYKTKITDIQRRNNVP